MQITLALPAGLLPEMARRLKEAFDRQQETDSGWGYVAFDHPAFGRGLTPTIAECIPGNILMQTGEPKKADALVIACGIIDPYTGDVLLADGDAVEGSANPAPPPDEEDQGGEPAERLPAVALWAEDGRVHALTGTLHLTQESRFELTGVGPDLDQALRDRLTELAAELTGHGQGLTVGQAPRSSAASGHGIEQDRPVLFDPRA